MTTFVLSNLDLIYADQSAAWRIERTRSAQSVQFKHFPKLGFCQALELITDLEFFLKTYPHAKLWPDVIVLLERLKAFCEPLALKQAATLETQIAPQL